MTSGKVSAYTGAAALLSRMATAEWLLADRGHAPTWFKDALREKGIKPCVPGSKSRSKSIRHDKRRCTRCNRIEIMFGRLKDRRRVVTRYDRCPRVFLSAVARAATLSPRQAKCPSRRNRTRPVSQSATVASSPIFSAYAAHRERPAHREVGRRSARLEKSSDTKTPSKTVWHRATLLKHVRGVREPGREVRV